MEETTIKLLKEEITEIEEYFERMNSLKDLALVFEADDIFSKNSSMYEKIINDTTETRAMFQSWWSRMIEKYNLHDYTQDKMFVDFIEGEIKLLN